MVKGRVPSDFYVVQRDEIPSASSDNGDIIITKGKKKKKLIKKNSDEIFTIIHNGVESKFNRSHLRETIRYLKPYAAIKLIDLDVEPHQFLQRVLEANEMLTSHEKELKLMQGDIEKEFADVSPIIPGTVGAHLVGCIRPSNFDGPKACSPNCVNSIGKCGEATCEQTMLFYENGTFINQNNKTTSDVYIFADKDKFVGFTADNLARLQANGVKTVSLVLGDGKGNFEKIVKYQSIESLPKNGTGPTGNSTGSQTPPSNGSTGSTGSTGTTGNTTQTTTTTENNAAWIIMIVVVVLIIIALLYLVWRNSQNRQQQ
jgi:hypothetical protein